MSGEGRSCGTCSLCCMVLGVRDIAKPRNKWCPHVVKGSAQSCSIHETKVIRLPSDPPYPVPCKEFRCLWLDKTAELPDWLRPDKVKAFFTGTIEGDGIVVHLHPQYPQAHLEQPLKGVLEKFHQNKIKVIMMCRNDVYMMHMGRWYKCDTTEGENGHIQANLKGHTVEIVGPPPIPVPFRPKY